MNFGIVAICFVWGMLCVWSGERLNIPRWAQYVAAFFGGTVISLILTAMWGN
jgi:uncharacterized membrane protein YccC